jgi:hypothetical protein
MSAGVMVTTTSNANSGPNLKMSLNFDPTKLTSPKERFVWTTVQYIMNMIKINVNESFCGDSQYAKYSIFNQLFRHNLSVLKKNIPNYDPLLDEFIVIDEQSHYEFNKLFLKMVDKIPISCDDEIFLL